MSGDLPPLGFVERIMVGLMVDGDAAASDPITHGLRATSFLRRDADGIPQLVTS